MSTTDASGTVHHILIPFIITSGGKTALVGIQAAIDLIQHGALRYSLDMQSICHLSIGLPIQSSHCVTQWDHPNDMRNNLIGGAVAMAIKSVDTTVRLLRKGYLSYEVALDELLQEFASHDPKRSDMDAELRLTLQAPITSEFPPSEVGMLIMWPSCPFIPNAMFPIRET